MDLHDLADEQGFRIRGQQPTRIDAFVDAAFAFAVTLLVISVGHVPVSVPELVQAMRGVPAFGASFILLARFWQSHRHWSRRYGLEDGKSVRLSLALVFVMLVYVYPLRMVATMVLAEFSGGLLVEQQKFDIRDAGELRTLYITFAIGYGVVVAIFAMLYRHALARADVIALSPMERILTRTSIARFTAFFGVAVLSIAFALVLPAMSGLSPLFYPLPGLVYLLASPIKWWLARRERAALNALDPRLAT